MSGDWRSCSRSQRHLGAPYATYACLCQARPRFIVRLAALPSCTFPGRSSSRPMIWRFRRSPIDGSASWSEASAWPPSSLASPRTRQGCRRSRSTCLACDDVRLRFRPNPSAQVPILRARSGRVPARSLSSARFRPCANPGVCTSYDASAAPTAMRPILRSSGQRTRRPPPDRTGRRPPSGRRARTSWRDPTPAGRRRP